MIDITMAYPGMHCACSADQVLTYFAVDVAKKLAAR